MLGWLAGALWAWRLWAYLGAHVDLSAMGLYLQDLQARLAAGGTLSTWDLPPCPALFPDLLWIWVARAWNSDPLAIQRLYGMIVGLLAWKYLARLLRGLWPLEKGPSRLLAASGLLAGLCLAPSPSWNAWLLPGQHGGLVLGSLAAWSWLLRQKERASGWAATLGLGLLVGALAACDPWAMLWLLPAWLLLALRLRFAAWARVGLGLLVAVAMAYAGRRWLDGHSAHLAEPVWSYVTGPGREAWAATVDRWKSMAGPAWPLLAAVGLACLLWAWPQPSRHSGLRVLGAACLVIASSSVLLALLMDLKGLGCWFWMLPSLFLLPALVAERWPALGRAAVLAPVLASLLAPSFAGSDALALRRQRQAAWLQAQPAPLGPGHGWADPGLARGLRLLSGGRLSLAPVLTDPQLRPAAWAGDRSLVVDLLAQDRPRYVIADGLDAVRLGAGLGAPYTAVQGQGLTVWYVKGR